MTEFRPICYVICKQTYHKVLNLNLDPTLPFGEIFLSGNACPAIPQLLPPCSENGSDTTGRQKLGDRVPILLYPLKGDFCPFYNKIDAH